MYKIGCVLALKEFVCNALHDPVAFGVLLMNK